VTSLFVPTKLLVKVISHYQIPHLFILQYCLYSKLISIRFATMPLASHVKQVQTFVL
jgi:hypothetical protein